MRALVVGGTGPTGPFLVQGLLDRGYEVAVLHRGTHEVPLPDVEHIHTDPHFLEPLQDALRGRSFDLVLATYGRLRLFVEALDGVSDRLITVGGTAYERLRSTPADESAPRRTANRLVQRIVETEQILLDAHAAGKYNVSHFRYPNLYGPRQLAPREWSIIRRILDGRPFIPVLDGGLTLESRAYVENAAHAVLLAVDLPAESAGRIYNVSDSYTPSDADRVLAIAEAMGAEIELLNFPRDIGRPAFFWGVGRDLEFSRKQIAPTTSHSILDNARIRTELGYVDPVPFDEANRRTVRWYLDHPPERGGEHERQLGDPFDYAAEDAYARALEDLAAAAGRIPFAGVEYVHQYDHPTAPAAR